MAILTCDICGGQLAMDSTGDFAICESCGMKHTKDRMKTKVLEITGTVKIDNSDIVKEQIDNWQKMADDAYDNRNYTEAYTYYCKVLEKNVDSWYCTFRKGMSTGWQADNNMRFNEVLGGIKDAIELLCQDKEQSDEVKANGTMIMAFELHDWIRRVYDLSVNHCNENVRGNITIATEFFKEQHSICTALIENIMLVSKDTYYNYNEKEKIEGLVYSIYATSNEVVKNIDITFKIEIGMKQNPYTGYFEKKYRAVEAEISTKQIQQELVSTVSKFIKDITMWKKEYAQITAEKIKREKEERIQQYWNEHTAEKQQYDFRIAEIDTELEVLKKQLNEYDVEINEIKKDLSKKVLREDEYIQMKEKQNAFIKEESQLGLFAIKQRKELLTKIDSFQPQLDELEKEVNENKRIREKNVADRVIVVEKERKPIVDRINALETEKSSINEELGKDR